MSSTMIDLCTVKQNFSDLMNIVSPWTLSHFVMWLDIKVAEYKVYGHMVLDNTPVSTPQWLKGKDISPDVQVSSNRNYQKLSHDQDRPPDQNAYRPQTTTRNTSTGSDMFQSPTRLQGSREHVRNSSVEDQSRNNSHPRVGHSVSDRLSLERTQHNVWLPSYQKEEKSTVPRMSGESHVGQDRTNRDMEISNKFVPRSDRLSSEYQLSLQSTGCSTTPPDKGHNSSLTVHPTSHRPVETFANRQVNKPSDRTNKNSISYTENTHPHQQPKVAEFSEKKEENLHHTDVVVKIEISDDSNEGNTHDESTSRQALPNFRQTFAGTSHLGLAKDIFNQQSFVQQDTSVSDISDEGQGHTMVDYSSDLGVPVPVSLHHVSQPHSMDGTSCNDSQQNVADPGHDLDQSWKDKKREYIQSVKKTNPVNPKAHARIVQRTKPFPDPFPVESLKYGRKAQDMIHTGIITRPAKMQFLDTVFSEIVKYTGLYPTPTQKMEVAKAIVRSFPTLNVRSKDSHISPADSWFVVLNDKFRNERRGLNQNPRHIRYSHIRQRAVQTLCRAQANYNTQTQSVDQL